MWAALAKAEKDIPLDKNARGEAETIPAGSDITITYGKNEKYALWRNIIYDLPEEYVGEIITIYSNQ